MAFWLDEHPCHSMSRGQGVRYGRDHPRAHRPRQLQIIEYGPFGIRPELFQIAAAGRTCREIGEEGAKAPSDPLDDSHI